MRRRLSWMMLTMAGLFAVAHPSGQAANTHEPGIYVATSGSPEAADSAVRLRGNKAQEMKSKGLLKTVVSQGFVKPSFAADLSGGGADIRQPAGDLTFYFYFDTKAGSNTDPMAALSSMMNSDVLPPAANKADDFVLIQLTPKEHSREAALGQVTNSAKSKAAIDCTVERLAQGAYRVRPKNALKPGEYAFYYAAPMGGGPSMQLWDFGVDAK